MWCCFTFFTHEVVIKHNFWHGCIHWVFTQQSVLLSNTSRRCTMSTPRPVLNVTKQLVLFTLLPADRILLLVMESHSSGSLELVIFLLTPGGPRVPQFGHNIHVGILFSATARRTCRGFNRTYSLGSTLADRACRLPPDNRCIDSE